MKRLPVDANSAVALVGLVLLGIGLALWYFPASPVVVGALLIVYAVLPDRREGTP